jgi:carbamoyltransferase
VIILGVHIAHRINDHDAGAAIIVDGNLVAVCEEERFSRIKTAKACLPIMAIEQALNQAGVSIHDVDYVISPGEKDPDAEHRLSLVLKHFFGYSPEIILINHQLAHLSSAYYASGFDNSMLISYDGSGDALSCVLAKGENGEITFLETYPATNSLGHFYELITQFLGFEPCGGEYKVMGLAPYGESNIDLSDVITITKNGYEYHNDLFYRSELDFSLIEVPFYSDALIKLLGSPRGKGEPVTQYHQDVAHAAQEKLTEAIIAMVSHLYQQTGYNSLCLAGGVALNCSANRYISQLPFIEKLFVQPSASDRGLALGCALWGANKFGGIKELGNIYSCGPNYTNEQIESALDYSGYNYQKVDDPTSLAAEYLEENNIIGWFQGRSEYGPRALGHRSILANPKHKNIKERINSTIKFREEFRPFAPSVSHEDASKYFEFGCDSELPHMTVAVGVKPDKVEEIAGVTHVNNTARVQTVSEKNDYLYHQLINSFQNLSGTPVVLNTSFNIKGQPIVETPLDAIATFSSCGLDALFMGNYFVTKR